MTTVFLDAVFKPFFLNRPWYGPTTDNRWDEFPDGWLPSNHSTCRVCECKHAISNTPKEKITHWKVERARGPRHVSETGNEVPGKRVSNKGHWLVCSVHCGQLATEVANPEEKNADHLVPLLSLPTEYYPFKRCQVPVGHPVLHVGEASVSRRVFLNFVVLSSFFFSLSLSLSLSLSRSLSLSLGIQKHVAQWVKCIENKGDCVEKMLLYRLK